MSALWESSMMEGATLHVKYFSGSIQGHGAGTIFGEDKRTGGGGSTVMKLDPISSMLPLHTSKRFPFDQELTSGSTTYANTLSVGVTQTIRTGRYKGKSIEDVGVMTDTVFRPQWSDLQPDPTTNTQYDRIAASLARTGQKNGQSRLHFVSEPFAFEKPIDGFSLEVEAAGIEEFTVFQADGKTVAAKQRSRATTKRKVCHPTVHCCYCAWDGWNNLKGKWMIGNGVKYVKNIESSIEAFFTATVGTKINISLNVDLDSVPDCDFLYLSVKSSGGVEDFLLSSKSLDGTKMFNGISGENMIVKETFSFTTKSEQFSVSLKFTSDKASEFAGATIKSFTVSAA
ncbi:hypothetical protein BASA61_009304 [Batrachochytrium salamandrivorans]|nr:hypothetical protein BASA61_009304 [Batrachochytrium salamandrivorans]